MTVSNWIHLSALALMGGMASQGIASAQNSTSSTSDNSRGYQLRILDENGKPIETAELKVTSLVQEAEAGTILSDANGVAVLEPQAIDPERGADVVISALGYRDTQMHISPERHGIVELRLKPSQDNGDIVVLAKRVSRPFSPSTLGLLDIVTDARANADPILAANDLPSSTNVAGNATLSLRATRPAISRLYLDDVPVFEFVRGGNLDNATQSGSILNLGNTKDVEVYPSNPPLYLAGSSGGALRALPPTTANRGGNLSVNTAAASLTGTLAPSSGRSFLTLSGLYSDLQPQLSINDDLTDLISRLRLRSITAIGRASIFDQSALNGFVQAETESGRFPVALYGQRTLFAQSSDRVRALSSYTTPVGAAILTINASYTRSQTRQEYAGFSSINNNRYIFLGTDFAGDGLGSRLVYRIGLDADSARQTSNETVFTTTLPIDPNTPSRVQNANTDVSGYAFASYRLSPNFLVSAGTRKTIFTGIGHAFSAQGSMTATTSDRRHKLIISAGKYFGIELPQFAYYGGLARSRSHQFELDYIFNMPGVRLGLSVYNSTESSDQTRSALAEGRFYVFDDTLTGIGRRTMTTGVEAFGVISPLSGLELKASLSHISQDILIDGTKARGTNDFNYIARGAIRYQLGEMTLNFAATAREGAPFTRIIGYQTEVEDTRIPVVGLTNDARLPPFFSLDLSLAQPIQLSSTIKPLAFLSINNLLDRRNASSQALNEDPASLQLRRYAGRVFTAGISLNF